MRSSMLLGSSTKVGKVIRDCSRVSKHDTFQSLPRCHDEVEASVHAFGDSRVPCLGAAQGRGNSIRI